MSFHWTDVRVEQLKEMWAGGMSASTIAARFGGAVTRNGVIGKAHRLSLATHALARDPDAPKVVKPKPEPVVRIKKVKLAPPPPPPQPFVPKEEPVGIAKPNPLNLPLVDLASTDCHWPINDGGPFLFCGHNTRAGSPYCEYHALVAVGSGTRSERAAGRVVA